MHTPRAQRTHRQGTIRFGLLGIAVLAGAGGGCAYPGAEGSGDIEVRTSALEIGEVSIPAGGSMNYFQCAPDLGTCDVGSGFRYVASGANGTVSSTSMSPPRP